MSLKDQVLWYDLIINLLCSGIYVKGVSIDSDYDIFF